MVAPARDHTATLLADGRVIVVGGFTRDPDSGTYFPTPQLYDPVTRTWSTAGSILSPQSGHTATLLADGRVLIAGGYACDPSGLNCQIVPTAQLYDPVANTWAATADMTVPRWLHTATLLGDGTVLVAGGNAGSNPFASAERYDPIGGQWVPAASMSVTRELHVAVLLPDGTVLVAGGVGGDSPFMLDSAELYSPSQGTWMPAGTMSVARSSHTVSLLPDGDALVAGGQLGNDSVANADLYRLGRPRSATVD